MESTSIRAEICFSPSDSATTPIKFKQKKKREIVKTVVCCSIRCVSWGRGKGGLNVVSFANRISIQGHARVRNKAMIDNWINNER